MHCVGLPTVLSRVRLQPSFGFPIAPQTIPSWILLLHMRSHPTGCRHLIVVVRPSCATWFVSITPTSSCIGSGQMPRSSSRTQTEPSAQGPLLRGRDRCNQHSQLLCFMVSLGSVLYISGWTVPWLYSLSPSQSERSIELHATSLLVAKGFGWRNRGGGPPMEYAS